jgi:hypothetical protein
VTGARAGGGDGDDEEVADTAAAGPIASTRHCDVLTADAPEII